MAFDFSGVFDTIYRAFISLIVLFFITKLLGRKQVSQLTLFMLQPSGELLLWF